MASTPGSAVEKRPPSPSLEAKPTHEVEDELQFTVNEKRLLRKLDLRVIPPLFVLFLMSFLDRSNIGNAKIQGLEKSLSMKGQDYAIALFVFFITYILCEVPSNLILKRLPPSTWLSFIITGWGKIPRAQPTLINGDFGTDLRDYCRPYYRGTRAREKLSRSGRTASRPWGLRGWPISWGNIFDVSILRQIRAAVAIQSVCFCHYHRRRFRGCESRL